MTRKLLTGKYFKGQIISKKVAVDYVVFACFINTFFIKQHFYKQHQVKIGTKSSKYKATPRGWTFAIWKQFTFFIYIIIQEYDIF